MNYVESLRVLRALRILAYVCVGFIVLSLVLKPFSHSGHGSTLSPAAGTEPVNRTAPDGTNVSTFTNQKGDQVTRVTSAEGVDTYTITHALRPGEHRKNSVEVNYGPVHVSRSSGKNTRTTVIKDDPRINLSILFAIAGGVAGIFGTMFGLAFSRENDGHLELAWTKPASRDRYGLHSILTDVAGIVAAGVLTMTTALILIGIQGSWHDLRADADWFPSMLFAAVFAFSFYALVLASTSSMRRGAVVLALMWPVALILPPLTPITWMSLGSIVRVIDTVNPIAYLYAYESSPLAVNVFTLLPPGVFYEIAGPLVLFIAGLVLSIMQWRRVEA
ncbi:MAG: ABC transporter permease [Candidatus Eremiobacteraeota bacterium]|nr:ABC transporter permease [Candidatus Eremiobacteraeota bacterium]